MKSDAVEVKSIVFVSVNDLASQPVLVGTDGYVHGALCLSLHGQPIITELEWDILDQLWAYIVDGLEKLDQDPSWSTFFPDQPIRLSISRLGLDCEIALEYGQVKRRGRFHFGLLRRVLLTEAERFFRTLEPLSPTNSGFYRMYLKKAELMLRRD